MWKYIVTAVASLTVGVIIGVFLEKFKMAGNKKIQSEKILIDTFGDSMYISRFSFDDLKKWIDGHKDDITKDDKVALIRPKKNLFEKLGKSIEISDDVDQYLLLAVISSNDSFKEHLLIKFDYLEDSVEEKLNLGDGILIVEV